MSSTIPESQVDVLIVGAGPAGLMAAHGLKMAGVNVRIIDQRPVKVAAGQADGIQPRTVEVLQSYGLAERLLREGNQMHMVAFYNPSPNGGIERTSRGADIGAPSARFPFEVTLHQGAIENIFLDSMKAMELEVDRPIVPQRLELSTNEAELKDPNAHAVKITLSRLAAKEGEPDTEVVRAKFVLGADGAHSWVRKHMGISMDGEQTKYIWGVLDLEPDTNFPDIRNRTAIHSHNGSVMIIPREGDKVRLYTQLSEDDLGVDAATGRLNKPTIGPEQLMEVARKTMAPFRVEKKGEFEWSTIYIIGQRVASQFSVNERVFIAGDACHTHSPKAGQGMNASMNDSHNLIWKLTQVLRGWSDMNLLKTYESERRKYAQDLINFDKKFAALFSGKPASEDNTDGVTHDQFMEAFRTFGGFTSGIGIHYAPSMVVNPSLQETASEQIVGMRILPHVFVRAADARPFELHDLLPADTRFKVLVFAGDVNKKDQLARVHKLAGQIAGENGFLQKYDNGTNTKFDVLSICNTKKEEVDYTVLPEAFRKHWSKVLVDDTDMFKRAGGGGYEKYGVDPEKGGVIVVRPDGYVGIVAPFEKVDELEAYFEPFLKA